MDDPSCLIFVAAWVALAVVLLAAALRPHPRPAEPRDSSRPAPQGPRQPSPL